MSIFSRELPFALDIGELTLKLIQLKKVGGVIKLVSFSEVDLPEECIKNGEIKNQEQFKRSLSLLLKSINGKRIKTKNLISVLPEPKTFIKWIKVEASVEELKQKKYQDGELVIPEIIIRETEEHIPLPIKEVYLDWQVIGGSIDSTEILIGVASKNIVNNYLESLKYCGFEVVALEIESVAIIRSLFPLSKPLATSGAKIIIDFGLLGTSLIIYAQNNIKFTVSLPISSKILTNALSQKLKIPFDKAEKAKVICGLDSNKCQGVVKEILSDEINQLIQKIKEAINFYKDHFIDVQEINEIIICGGGSNLVGLDELLASALGKSVKKADPLINIRKAHKNFTPDHSLRFTTTIGLALRAIYDKDLVY